jgi:uncharacterized membrane protein
MSLGRVIRHSFAGHAGTRRSFGDAVLADIDAAIGAAEARTSGEIRFVVETALELRDLWAGVTPRERAAHVFSDLHIWNTELRNGVLIYVLRADRDVEILADRGAAAAIPAADWERAAQVMEEHFRAARFREGAVAGVQAVAELLARHFPARGGPRGDPRDDDGNELPNQPILL